MTQNVNEGANIAPKSNGLAVASLVLGICSIVFFWLSFVGLACGILAIVFGVVAKNKVKADPQVGGAGNAKAGLVTGIIGVVFWVIMVIVVAMFFTAAVSVLGESGELQDALNDLNNELNNLD